MVATQWQWIGNLITAVATIGGVLIGQLFTRRLENKRQRREDSIRWLQDQRQAYADFQAAATRTHETVGYFRVYELGDPHHATIEDQWKELARAHELLYLIATPEVLDKADDVRRALKDYWLDSHEKMDGVAYPSPDAGDPSTDQGGVQYLVLEAVSNFRKTARRSLGVDQPEGKKGQGQHTPDSGRDGCHPPERPRELQR